MEEQLHYLRRFAFSEKFRLSFKNAIAFTGKFIDHSIGTVICKQLFIPLSEKHPAFTFKIASAPFSKTEVDSLIVHFESLEERELVANFDFSNEYFFIEK